MLLICSAVNGSIVIGSGGKWGPSNKGSGVGSSRSTIGLSGLKGGPL